MNLNKLSIKRIYLSTEEQLAVYGFHFKSLKEFRRKLEKKHCAELSNYYLRNYLRSKYNLQGEDIPQIMIKNQREILLTKRLLKKLRRKNERL